MASCYNHIATLCFSYCFCIGTYKNYKTSHIKTALVSHLTVGLTEMGLGNVQSTLKCLSSKYLLINIGRIICRTGRACESFCERLQLPQHCLQPEKQNVQITVTPIKKQNHQMSLCSSPMQHTTVLFRRYRS